MCWCGPMAGHSAQQECRDRLPSHQNLALVWDSPHRGLVPTCDKKSGDTRVYLKIIFSKAHDHRGSKFSPRPPVLRLPLVVFKLYITRRPLLYISPLDDESKPSKTDLIILASIGHCFFQFVCCSHPCSMKHCSQMFNCIVDFPLD